eukprot:NODE_1270_length_1497_cov_37.366713_g1055_i0.p1 GENE.NODE_1270_length_1497_cov_37.366713_g1055_i0~~NODE_1270_length_1497_cov_37.366713_g1055_i0.p1  ORF type:complete len:440 (-),score=108.69 NODE_1270_length_1497_cov_37.366713_g1055_i0:56-1375(-)
MRARVDGVPDPAFATTTGSPGKALNPSKMASSLGNSGLTGGTHGRADAPPGATMGGSTLSATGTAGKISDKGRKHLPTPSQTYESRMGPFAKVSGLGDPNKLSAVDVATPALPPALHTKRPVYAPPPGKEVLTRSLPGRRNIERIDVVPAAPEPYAEQAGLRLGSPDYTSPLRTGSPCEATIQRSRGAEPAPDVDGAFQKLKAHLIKRGQGIRGFTLQLRIFDKSKDVELSRGEFFRLLEVYGFWFSYEEAKGVFGKFDTNRDGSINITELLRALRGAMEPRREQFVKTAYSLLDANRDGTVTLHDLLELYDVSRHPDVLSGSKKPEEVMQAFAAGWDKNEDGVVTWEEFKDYYEDISCGIESDEYWELLMRNAWHISGGSGVCSNTTCRRVLVTHEDGSQTVEEIKNDLGIGKDDIDKMIANLEAQGITDISRIDLTG